MEQLQSLLIELDGLKSVYRKSYISDGSRNENSAEHSWHLAMALMSLKSLLPSEIKIDHAIKLALVHDICEIGPGDVCAYDPNRADKAENEEAYLTSLAEQYPAFGTDVLNLWFEYESQQTLESHWVKVVDMLPPFLLNLASEGRTWQEQNITATMVRKHNKFVHTISPEIHEWMMGELENAINKGWLAKA
jgi:putative hydrolase of HD superfamily